MFADSFSEFKCSTSTIKPVTTCSGSATLSCLTLKNNLPKNTVTLSQIVVSGTPLCTTLDAGKSVILQVDYESSWQVFDTTTGEVLIPHVQVLSQNLTLQVNPKQPDDGPDGKPGPVINKCVKIPFLPITIIWTLLAIIGIIASYRNIPKNPDSSNGDSLDFNTLLKSVSTPTVSSGTTIASSGDSGTLDPVEAYKKQKSIFKTVLIIGIVGLAIVVLLWLVADGPLGGSGPSCSRCLSRGAMWNVTKPPDSASFFTKLKCRFLGRCPCTSEILQDRCWNYNFEGGSVALALASASSVTPSPSSAPQPMFKWDAESAGQEYASWKVGDATAPFNCKCCRTDSTGTVCVDCTMAQPGSATLCSVCASNNN